MVWVELGLRCGIVGRLNIPQPAGTFAGTAIKLGVPFVCTIDIECTIAIAIREDSRSLLLSHHLIGILLVEFITGSKPKSIGLTHFISNIEAVPTI